MRAYQRILLVALLAAVFVAAGAAAVRIYLSPLADQAARARGGRPARWKTTCPPPAATNLPRWTMSPAAGPSSAAAADALHESRSADRGNVLRPETELAAGGAEH